MAKKIPLRMCLGCRGMKPKNELTRVVRSPEGVVSIDINAKSSGRGAYICNNPECFKRIIKSKALSRALGTAIPEDIYEKIQETTQQEQLDG